MPDGAALSRVKRPNPLPVLMLATLVAGTLDISTALVFFASMGVAPTRILQGIAGGLLGHASFDGGLATAALGGLLHYCIMFAMVLAYYLSSLKMARLREEPYLWGGFYGVFLLLLMNYVVVPLSAYPLHSNVYLPWFLCDLGAHVFFVGMPAALFARWAYGLSRSLSRI